MRYVVQLTNFGTQTDRPTFSEAVAFAKRTGFECGIWLDDSTTFEPTDLQLVATYSPIGGLKCHTFSMRIATV